MIDATRMPVQDAVTRFASLGVLRRSDIEAAAGKDGMVNVIRFQDTERLPVSIARSDHIFHTYVKGEVQSMRSVNPEFFEEVLRRQLAGARNT
jgi:hypothetical protein